MADQTASASIKAQIINILNEAHTADHTFIDNLNNAEKAQIGTLEQWSPKDILAHNAFWRRNMCKRLDTILNGTSLPEFDELNVINNANFEREHLRPWADIVAELDDSLASLVAYVQRYTDEQLSGDKYYPGQQGSALWQGILGNGYSHPQTHYSEFYIKNNQMPRAIELNEQMAEAVSKVGNSRGRAIALYNLACFYALANQPTKALPLVTEALQLAPDLLEWSKQDTDLDSLRAEPAFQALYTS